MTARSVEAKTPTLINLHADSPAMNETKHTDVVNVTESPRRLIGRKLSSGQEDLRELASVRLVGSVHNDCGLSQFCIHVYRSTGETERDGLVLELTSSSYNEGFVPHFVCSADRLVLHQGGQSEAKSLATAFQIAAMLAQGRIAEAAAEASALGVGFSLPSEYDRLETERQEWLHEWHNQRRRGNGRHS